MKIDIPFLSSSWAMGSSETHWASSEQSILRNVQLQECEVQSSDQTRTHLKKTRHHRQSSFCKGINIRIYYRHKSPHSSGIAYVNNISYIYFDSKFRMLSIYRQ